MRALRLMLAAAMAAGLFSMSAGSAAAYQVISEVGSHGHYSLDDTLETPGGKCTYGPVVYSNWAYLISMKVNAPHVFAADRNSAKREHRVVSWQWKLQRKRYEATTWHTIKSSAIQKKTAYEDAQALFTGMTIKYNAEKEDPNHLNGTDIVFRALVVIKWFKPDGSVESTVKLVPDWYTTVTYWNAQPSNIYCSRINTNG